MMTAEYELVTLAGGTHSVRALELGETFHPVIGPAAEAEALYVRQLRLRERFEAWHEAKGTREAEPFVIWDVGLGAAANVMAAMHALEATAGRLVVASFDRTLAPLEFGLRHAEALGYFKELTPVARQLAATGRALVRGPALKAEWRVHLGDFPELLKGPEAEQWPKPHAIMFDAFSPARNPDMWTLPLFRRLYELLDPARPCALPTYSRSTLLRVTLLLAGFFVGSGHATGEKEETTVAANCAELVLEPLGRRWLERAKQSTSAEPLRNAAYEQRPLCPETWEALRRHPQFLMAHG
jgi:tRNA U34 5-methylaminomethyl-2-thiouridine-forming methyltransferase MnmC